MKKIIFAIISVLLLSIAIFAERQIIVQSQYPNQSQQVINQACYQCENPSLYIWFNLPDTWEKRRDAKQYLKCSVIRAIKNCPSKIDYPQISIQTLD